MKSLADAAAFALALAAQDMPPGGEGPRATSGEAQRHDHIGRAIEGEAIAHRTLPPGSIVEVTSLADGTTLLMRIAAVIAPDDGVEIALPRPLLDRMTAGRAEVRVRMVTPSPQDEAALRSGQIVERQSAPAALLAGLRRQAAAAPPIAQPTPPKPVGSTTPTVIGGWSVQVAALSSEARAKALAREMNGTAQPSGNLWRVHMGPFTARAAADSARAKAIARGFGDARIYRSN